MDETVQFGFMVGSRYVFSAMLQLRLRHKVLLTVGDCLVLYVTRYEKTDL